MKLFCTKYKCSKVINPDNSTNSACSRVGVRIEECPFKDKHVYQSRIYNPITKRQDRVRSYPGVKDPVELQRLHEAFEEELRANNYYIDGSHQRTKERRLPRLNTLKYHIDRYFNYLNDIGIPEYERRYRNKKYIQDEKRYIGRFMSLLKERATTLLITEVKSFEVDQFYKYLNNQDFMPRTWNAHINAMVKFFNWVNKDGINVGNPFSKVRRRYEESDPTIIEEHEFKQLLKVIHPYNGIEVVGKSRIERKQRYKPWLKHWLLLSIHSGGRRQDIAMLKCHHLKDDHLEIPNNKLNSKENTVIHKSYVPLTEELKEVLEELEVSNRSGDEYIICPDRENRRALGADATSGFKYFWDLTGIEKGVSLHALRRTYVTGMIKKHGIVGASIHHKKVETAFKFYTSRTALTAINS